MRGREWVIRGVLAMVLAVLVGLGGSAAWGPRVYRVMAEGEGEEAAGVLAPLGTGFTYQGRLWADAVPVNAACSFRFELYDAAEGGALVAGPVNPVEGNPVAVEEGYFTAGIDFGAAVFEGQARWLSIAVQCPSDPGWVPMAGRVGLSATPYALYARTGPWGGLVGVPGGFADGEDADTLGGLSCASGQIAKRSGGVWSCGADDTDDAVSWAEIVGIVGTGATQVAVGDHGHAGEEITTGTVAEERIAESLARDSEIMPAVLAGDGAGSGLDADVLDGQDGAHYLAWGNLTGVPAGFADGEDADVLGGLSCANGQVAKRSGGVWSCGADATDDAVSWAEIVGIVGTGATQVAVGDHGHTGVYSPVGHVHAGEEITSGSLSTDRFSAYGDLTAEGYLDTNASSDLLTRSQADTRFVNEGQGSSVNSNMIQNGTILFADLGQNGCSFGQVIKWKYEDWLCADDLGAVGSFWSLAGNAGTNPGTDYLGTSDNQPLELRVNNVRALRLEPKSASPNVVGGYSGNSVTFGSYGATIGGGGVAFSANQVTDNYGTVGGGIGNTAGNNVGDIWDGGSATVGGGEGNSASGDFSTVGGGFSNWTQGSAATVAGGVDNDAGGAGSAVGGGYQNQASGDSSAVPGGQQNYAGGAWSLASGYMANATHDGSFVWSSAASTSSFAGNSFTVRAHGGARFYTASGTSTGVQVASGGTSWGSISDRNAKEHFAAVDAGRLLETLAALPVQTWNLKAQPDTMRHIGPMAQDFNQQFGYLFSEVESPVHINNLDAIGVALAAAQELYRRSQEQEAEIAGLTAENAELRRELDGLEARLASLEAGGGAQGGKGGTVPPLWAGAGLLVGGLAAVWVSRRGGSWLGSGGGR